MTAAIPTDWITLSLEAVNGIIGIINKGQFSEAERAARWEVKRIRRLAKANLKADKLTLERLLWRIKGTELGLQISKKYGLDEKLLLANLEKLCLMLSELKHE